MFYKENSSNIEMYWDKSELVNLVKIFSKGGNNQ